MWVVNIQNGKVFQKLVDAADHGMRDQYYPSWSPSDKEIVWSNGKFLWIMNSDGSNQRRLTNNKDVEYEYSAKWSPDGKTIAYISDEEIWLVDRTGKNERLFRNGIHANDVEWSKDGEYLYYNDDYHVLKAFISGDDSPIKVFEEPRYYFDLSPDEKCVVYDDLEETKNLLMECHVSCNEQGAIEIRQ